MNRYLIKALLILQLVTLVFYNVISQSISTNRSYYQDQLDYLPHIQSYQHSVRNSLIRHGLEFNKALEEVLNSCTQKKYSLISHFGEAARMSGISPIGMSRDSYFILELDEFGNVTRLNIYNSDNSEQIEECFLDTLKAVKINPGLKELRPVKCYFVYIYEHKKNALQRRL